MNLYLPTNDSVKAMKQKIAIEYFDGECFICHKSYGKWFAYHHKEYDPRRKTHADFKNTTEYNRYVIPEVIANPERFRLLCKVCHARIDQPRRGYLGHLKKDILIRTFIAALETIPKPRGKNGGDFPSSSSQNVLENNKRLDACTIIEIDNLKRFLTSLDLNTSSPD